MVNTINKIEIPKGYKVEFLENNHFNSDYSIFKEKSNFIMSVKEGIDCNSYKILSKEDKKLIDEFDITNEDGRDKSLKSAISIYEKLSKSDYVPGENEVDDGDEEILTEEGEESVTTDDCNEQTLEEVFRSISDEISSISARLDNIHIPGDKKEIKLMINNISSNLLSQSLELENIFDCYNEMKMNGAICK